MCITITINIAKSASLVCTVWPGKNAALSSFQQRLTTSTAKLLAALTGCKRALRRVCGSRVAGVHVCRGRCGGSVEAGSYRACDAPVR
jgi:hypothetical protein